MPKLNSFLSLNTFGVINITPNSFSDANKFNQIEILKTTLNTFKILPDLVIDIGFESTAPMNSAITLIEERNRFDLFFESIKDIDLSGTWISFDTYKTSNYSYFEELFKTRYQNCGFIYNDVSGVVDNELIEYLKTKSTTDKFYYILSSTHIPMRSQVLNHTQFIREGDILEMSFKHLKKCYEELCLIGFKDKIIFDPAFGFSKSYEQNWDLINRFTELTKMFIELNIHNSWLVGISKKSFLRKSLSNSTDPFQDSEVLHSKIIKKIYQEKLGHLLFRVHDPKIVIESIDR